MGVRSMRKCEKAQLLISHQYALGELGCPPRIPGKAQILAVIELMDFTEESQAEAILAIDKEERRRKYSFDEIEKICKLENSCGNQSVREKEFSLALKNYSRARRLLRDTHLADEDEEIRYHSLLEKVLLNTAHCAIKLHRPEKACTACKEAIKIKESAKAFYRFGIAKRQLEDYESAKWFLLKAQSKSPQSVNIANELRILEDYLAQEKKREAAMCQNMFKGLKKPVEKEVESEFYHLISQQLKEFKDAEDEDSFTLTQDSLCAKELKEGWRDTPRGFNFSHFRRFEKLRQRWV